MGARRLMAGVLASSLVVAAVGAGLVVRVVLPDRTSDRPSSDIGPGGSPVDATVALAAEVGRAGQQLDAPISGSTSGGVRSGVPSGSATGLADGAMNGASGDTMLAATPDEIRWLTVPVADRAAASPFVSSAGPASPSRGAQRSDPTGEFGVEGVGGSAASWPDWATCAFEDGRTSEPGARSVVVDRDRQRSWFCDGTEVVRVFPITTARSQPDPGVYEVYAKDMHTSSTFGGGYSTMTHFVAFTYGKYQGARVAFHSVPVYPGGSWVQPLESVGSLDRFGDSSGCIRALPDDAEAIWDWLAIGDVVRVVT